MIPSAPGSRLVFLFTPKKKRTAYDVSLPLKRSKETFPPLSKSFYEDCKIGCSKNWKLVIGKNHNQQTSSNIGNPSSHIKLGVKFSSNLTGTYGQPWPLQSRHVLVAVAGDTSCYSICCYIPGAWTYDSPSSHVNFQHQVLERLKAFLVV